jgi:MFS family permease
MIDTLAAVRSFADLKDRHIRVNVLPFLVFLVKGFGGDALIFGILSARYPAFQFIGAPILGRWSDIYGRKCAIQSGLGAGH